jgi:hypothetical protein
VRGQAFATPWLGRFVARRSGLIVWVSVIATLGSGIASRRLHLDTAIDRLQAKTPGADLERVIADRFSLPRDVLLVLNENDRLEPLLETDDRLATRLAERDPTMTVSGIGFLLPSAHTQEDIAREIRATSPSAGRIDQDVRAAAQRAGFRPEALSPFLDRVPRIIDPDQRITFDGLMNHGLGSIVSRFLTRQREGGEGRGRYVAVTYVYPHGSVNVAALQQIVREVDPALRLTGLSVVNQDLAGRFLPEFLKGIGIGAVAVALLIYAVFRTIRLTLLALLPTVVGFIWSAGVLALLGVELDLFSLFAAVTFIGIAVDYGIYVLYRYAVEGTRDMSEVLSRTGAAITIACLTALIGFGTLVNSSYGPLRTFGIVSIVTLTCCLAASLLLLPALILQSPRWTRSAP